MLAPLGLDAYFRISLKNHSSHHSTHACIQ